MYSIEPCVKQKLFKKNNSEMYIQMYNERDSLNWMFKSNHKREIKKSAQYNLLS